MTIGNVRIDKNQLNALVFGFLVLLLPVAVYFASNVTKDYRGRAAPSASLNMVVKDQSGNVINANPDNTHTVNQGEQISLDVMLTTGADQVEMALMTIDYPGDILSINYNVNPTSSECTLSGTTVTCKDYCTVNATTGIITSCQPGVTVKGMHLSTDIYCGVNQDPFDSKNYLGDSWFRGVETNDTTTTSSPASVPLGSMRILCGAGSNSVPFTPLRPVPTNSTTKIATLTFTVTKTTPSSNLNFRINTLNLDQSPTLITKLGCRQAVETNPSFVCENILDVNQTTGLTITTDVYVPPTNTPVPTSTSVPPTATTVPTATPTPSTAGPSLTLTTASTVVNVNQNFDVQIRANSSGQLTSGVDTVVDFDQTKFQVNSVTANSASTVFTNYQGNTAAEYAGGYFSNTSGRVDISGLVGTTSPSGKVLNNELVATINFRAIAQIATSSIAFYVNATDPLNDSNIAAVNTGNDILVVANNLSMTVNVVPTNTPVPTATNTPIPTATNTPIPTATNTPVPTATNTPVPTATNTPVPTATTTPIPNRVVTFTFTLQGRSWSTNLLKRLFIIRAFDPGLTVPQLTLTSSLSNADGTFNDPALTFADGSRYDIVMSPKGFLNKAVRNQLISSSQIDMGEFKAGDLDGSGKVNTIDYNLLLTDFKKQFIGDSIGNDPTEIADVDGSKQVNSLDFSLLLANFNKCGAFEDTDNDGIPDVDITLGTTVCAQ